MAKIGLIGAGSWGTALSKLVADNGHDVAVWSIVKEEIEMLRKNREHLDKLPGVKLPENISYTTELSEAIEGMDLCILAVPSPFTRSTAAMMKPFVKEGQIIVNVAKGVEEKTLMTLSEIIEEEVPGADVAVPCGGSGKGNAHDDRSRSQDKENGGIYSEPSDEQSVSGIYQSGYAGDRAGRRVEECDRAGGGHSRRAWLRRQYKGGIDHPGND